MTAAAVTLNPGKLVNSQTCGWPIDLNRVTLIADRAARLLGLLDEDFDTIMAAPITEAQAEAILTGRGIPKPTTPPHTAQRLTTQSGSYGPWYGISEYEQARTRDGRRVWKSTGQHGHLSRYRAGLTGLEYGSLHAKSVDDSVPFPPNCTSINDLPEFR